MPTIRRAGDRGHTNLGWLDSHHTFAFGDYWDEAHLGYRSLRVINDDRIAPAMGFGMHGHRDMEIVTWILAGSLEHRDSLGNGGLLTPGIVQRMSAGTGIRHSEYNPSKQEALHLLQIWIEPTRSGAKPRYDQALVPVELRRDRFHPIAGQGAELELGADASVAAALIGIGQRVVYELRSGRHAWLHLARGRLRLAGEELVAGDAVAFDGARSIELEGVEPSEALLFDLV